MQACDERRALLALLDYYGALGVDCVLDDVPHDRYAEIAPVPAPVFSPPPPAPERLPAKPADTRTIASPLPPQEAERAAKRIAAAATTLAELRQGLAAFDGGGAIARARHFLFAAGTPAELMVLDYAPGETEEGSGAPFSGPEARLLGAMLAAIGRSFENAYCAYFSPWRPPGGQKLAPHAVAALAPFARRHIELAQPRVVLLLGDAATSLASPSGSRGSPYAQRLDLRLEQASPIALSAPGLAAMLKTPALKPQAWRALRLAAQVMGD
jgi:uracil-DNA glycosylase